jgi:hypothetical protein
MEDSLLREHESKDLGGQVHCAPPKLGSDGDLEVSTTDEVVASMMALTANGRRRYVLENQNPHKRAEMLVRMICREDGSKQFDVISESGWGGARSTSSCGVHFVHDYHKNGPFWFPVSDRSVTDVRIFGATEMTIEYFDYSPNRSLGCSQYLATRDGWLTSH